MVRLMNAYERIRAPSLSRDYGEHIRRRSKTNADSWGRKRTSNYPRQCEERRDEAISLEKLVHDLQDNLTPRHYPTSAFAQSLGKYLAAIKNATIANTSTTPSEVIAHRNPSSGP
jgi:hypothetical protein